MVGGAIYPNGTNFRRVARLDVVSRVRRLCETKLLEKRPQWLEWCERVPPLENHSLHLQAREIRNPYRQLVDHLLKKHPDLRFQDCYVDGNDWSKGNDAYRDDHPVMQFVATQLQLMRMGEDGKALSKKEAFERTEELFRERRSWLEQNQKVMMAMALEKGLQPMFSTGAAYLQAETARAEEAHLQIIRRVLRERREQAASMQNEDKLADKTMSKGDRRRDRKETEKNKAQLAANSRLALEKSVYQPTKKNLERIDRMEAEGHLLSDVVDWGKRVNGKTFKEVLLYEPSYLKWANDRGEMPGTGLYRLLCYSKFMHGELELSELHNLLLPMEPTVSDAPLEEPDEPSDQIELEAPTETPVSVASEDTVIRPDPVASKVLAQQFQFDEVLYGVSAHLSNKENKADGVAMMLRHDRKPSAKDNFPDDDVAEDRGVLERRQRRETAGGVNGIEDDPLKDYKPKP